VRLGLRPLSGTALLFAPALWDSAALWLSLDDLYVSFVRATNQQTALTTTSHITNPLSEETPQWHACSQFSAWCLLSVSAHRH